MERSAHNRHPPTRSQSAHRPRTHDRSPPDPFPVSFVPFDIRPEHPLAPTETACSSNSREETTATPVRPALRLAPALAIPGSGSSRSCPILRSNTNRMRAFLGYRSIIDHQHGIAAADELIRLNQQF